jgi:hypothetical protein
MLFYERKPKTLEWLDSLEQVLEPKVRGLFVFDLQGL